MPIEAESRADCYKEKVRDSPVAPQRLRRKNRFNVS